MAEYYQCRPRAEPAVSQTSNDASATTPSLATVLSEFDQLRQGRITRDNDKGWVLELHRYLRDIPVDVTKHTDVVKWWQVCLFIPH